MLVTPQMPRKPDRPLNPVEQDYHLYGINRDNGFAPPALPPVWGIDTPEAAVEYDQQLQAGISDAIRNELTFCSSP